MDEMWESIFEFPEYDVSSFGRIARARDGFIMRLSRTGFGDVKITLRRGMDRHTLSVKKLVADAFVPGRSEIFDSVICKDNDKTNLHDWNLLWRPYWFAWKYTHQFKEKYPPHYYNLPVMNIDLNVTYGSVVEAATAEGAIFEEVFRSCYSGDSIFPNWHTYVIL
jgi:hypothetical protein